MTRKPHDTGRWRRIVTPFTTILLSVLPLLASPGVAIGATPQSESSQVPMQIRGINVLYSGSDASDPQQIATLLTTLAAMHVNTIVLTVPIYIDSLTGSQIVTVSEPTAQHPNADTPTPEELQAFIRPAIAQGFTIWLRPLLDERSLIAEDPDAWRGQVQPADADTFFATYTTTLQTLLRGGTGAAWLVIGTELTTLQESRYDSGWSAMIANLRAIAPGVRLGYAENWDTRGFPQFPGWMDALDGIAIDAYYPLAGLGNDATAQEVANAWSAWTETVRAYRERFPDKTIIFGEVGISSQRLDRSVFQAPWQWPIAGAPADATLQATYVSGTCTWLHSIAAATTGTTLLDGVAWWMASVIPVEDPATDTTFAIVGKPAQDAVSSCFANWPT